ncbi:uncharacterized protein C1orf43 homolog [Microtus ochrogaster]|uniref:Uncharacterized protein C1orf43 homolog n=1 Tax=Microtus ochrogaster TaxID=79684 RepID=A0ABM1USR6_MICOH|nr:uncharacterized protein C1orf43 homolog [Microtus ochrogaster]
MASSSNWLSGVNVVLVMAYGSLVFVLLFIFVKRQIMRFAMKSRRGPHVPVGHNAPKDLKEEIDIRLSRVQDIKYEPQLLADDDTRLLQLESQGNQSCYNYLYRMKALDAIRASGKLADKAYSRIYSHSVHVFCVFFRVKARIGSSQKQHQSAAKDLTQSPEMSPTTIQVTYLPSSQKSKRPKHFLELKSFKDNYNTLESTL